MTKINLAELNIKKAHDLLQNGEISARELFEFYDTNIKKHDREIHAYLELFSAGGGSASGGDDAYEQAEKIDKEIKGGKELPILAGMPLAIKDNILIKNKKCSAGSKILENFTAPYDATVIKKLKANGAVFLGRTNMDEFAMGSSTEHSAFGPTKNPYDTARVPGGSSGGSAAAVAQQMCLAALGSDTGGSVRQPAAFCGVVGLKPTYGSVSRYGLIAMASSLDQIGPLAKSVEDAEIIFNIIKGRNPLDSTTVDLPKSNLKIQNLTLGVPAEFFEIKGRNENLDKEVALSVGRALEVFKDLGFQIKQVETRLLRYAIEIYYIVMPAEVSSNLARYDGVKYGFSQKGENLLDEYLKTRRAGFGEEPRRRILLGTYVLSAGYYDEYYGLGQKARNLLRAELRELFKEVDVLFMPTTPTLPFKIGERTDDPVQMYLADLFTSVANLTGNPAISIPCDFVEKDGKKLPVGFQLMASWFEEEKLFHLGKLFENALH
jgi:aspartyl-tRNA(Asn)/glutamyl-tRNA(Gln) amidotransferase subunit A